MKQPLLSFLLLLALVGQTCCWAFTSTNYGRIMLSLPTTSKLPSPQRRDSPTSSNELSLSFISPQQIQRRTNNHCRHHGRTLLSAGGFEWEDPTDALDQGVENPYKNEELMKAGEDGMKIDPARLLGPRLNGSNVYLIGMMGSGKSSVGDKVARRTLFCFTRIHRVWMGTFSISFIGY